VEPKDTPENQFGKWTIVSHNLPEGWDKDPEMQRVMQTLIEAAIIAAQQEGGWDQVNFEDDPDAMADCGSELGEELESLILEDIQEYPEALEWIMSAWHKGQEQNWNSPQVG
jgi:hypothetical protein